MASNATFEPGALDVLNATLDAAQASSSPVPAHVAILNFLSLDVRLVVFALAIIYVGSHGALRRPPSAAPALGNKDGDGGGGDDDDSGRFSEGLGLSDAILFPVMAGFTLVGLYYLIQWLQDPAILNRVLRYYVTSVSLVSVLTLYAHALDLAASLLFPTYWRGGDGSLRKVDQHTRAVALCDAAGNVVSPAAAAAAAANPLPGLLALLAPTDSLRKAAWQLRGVFSQRWEVDTFARGMGEVKTQLRFSHVVALLLSVGTALVYFSTESPLLSNLLGYGMCYGSFLILSPTDFLTGSLVLWGLFFYDVVMVFYTPYMITVATTLDVPIKLTFESDSGKSMLGLGDIVIPGMMIAWALRLDLWLHYARKIKYESTDLVLVEKDAASGEVVRRSETKHREVKAPYVDVKGRWGDGLWSRGAMFLLSRPGQLPPHLAGARFAKVYFHAAMAGYALGMAVTVAVLRITRHGQPALLYLVPGVLGAVALTAWARGEFKDVCRYTEDGSLDTMDVVVDLDGDGNAIKRIGPLENGVVDTTADGKKSKEDEDGKNEKAADDEVNDRRRRRRVFMLSMEAVEDF